MSRRRSPYSGSRAAIWAANQPSITDEQIRQYVGVHWREPWMDGGPGKGCINDAAIILFSETTPFGTKSRIRAEFHRLIHAYRARTTED